MYLHRMERGFPCTRVYPDARLEEFNIMGANGVTERSVRRSQPLPGPKSMRGLNSAVYLFLLGDWIRDSAGKRPQMAFLVLGYPPSQPGKYERVGYGTCLPEYPGTSRLGEDNSDRDEYVKKSPFGQSSLPVPFNDFEVLNESSHPIHLDSAVKSINTECKKRVSEERDKFRSITTKRS
ncbi:hypothetical protein QBC32DRAFT_356323 [Pseudoneurospora amorphoporcata]|uniref:Uncharacterized protein n=1 Tax=Pseudoneurospora amorphoporcata TaxID=241081 RepID=A0AAN6NJU2_9PEZI|nr:hypothetical protein QBC32DRAFT_356323 [Pseudoneurospora amorphoporcata]